MNADSVGGAGAGVRSRLAGFRLASLFLLASLGLPSGSLAVRRPMNLDDMYNFKDLTQEAISPDGRQIAYVLSLPGGKENKGFPATRLWLLDVASGKSRALSAARNVSDLAWSPDGGVLAYIGSRDGEPEVWLQTIASDTERPLVSGEPGAAGHRKHTVYAFAWSPSGAQIACIASLFVPRATGPAAPAPKVLIKGVDRELTMDTWIDRDPFLETVDVASGNARRLSQHPVVAGSYYESLVWSGDGNRILFTARDHDIGREDSDDLSQRDVFVADTVRGSIERLGGTVGYDAYPVWAPRGDAVFFLGKDAAGSYERGSALRRLDLKTREVTVVLDDVRARSRQSLAALAGRDALLVTKFESANQRLYKISLASGKAEALSPPGMFVVDYSVAADQDTIAAIFENANDPPEIYVGSISGRTFRKRTDLFRDERENFALASIEKIQWPSKDGRFQIDGFLVKPPDFDPKKKYPLIVNIHGGPGADYLNDFQSLRFSIAYHSQMEYYAAHGYLILLPNHRGGVTNAAGSEFGNALRGHFSDSYDLDVDPGVDFVLRRPYVDGTRMVLVGASYGGYATAWGITRTNRYKASSINDSPFNLVSSYGESYPVFRNFGHFYMGGSPLEKWQKYVEESPLFHADKIETPVLIRCGNTDGTLSPYDFHSQSLELWAALSERGVPVELIVHPFEGHGIHDIETGKDYAVRNLDWFNFWLSGVEDPAPGKAEQYRRWEKLRTRWAAKDSGGAAPGAPAMPKNGTP